MLGPSLSTLRCWVHPSPLGGARARPSSPVCGAGAIHLHCGVGAIPSLSALRYRDVSIPPPFGGARARPSLSGLRCWVHPSPLCGAGAIHLHSAVSVRSHPSPLYGIGTFPSLHRSAVLGRDHPSPVCGAGSIPLHSAVLGPSLSTLRCWGHPSPLCGVVAIPSLSALRYRDVSIPPPFGDARARPCVSGLRCWGHPSPLCGAFHLHSAVPSISTLRCHPSPLRCRCDPIPLRSIDTDTGHTLHTYI